MSEFHNPGQKVGIEIWRIEKMKAVAAPPETYGTFYSGDCYIVLKTYEKSGARYMDLYFWLGKDSSQDEQGAVAYKTVELDDQLGGKPVQHREVQNHESQEFLGLFPKLKYLDGGMESGFRHVKPNDYKPRLLHLKGKHHVACKQVALASTSMNEGDVFILDNGLTLYQWNGSKANKYEKAKGLEIAQGIKDDERGGKARIVLMESASKDDQDAFWKLLGGKAGVKAAIDDDDAKASDVALFRLSDASGSLQITPVATAPAGQLDRDLLDGNDVFLADDGHQVFVWVGKKTTDNERRNAIPYATQYLQQAGRPAETACTRIAEGAEIAVFKGLFKNFNKPKPQDFKAAKKPDPKPDDFSALFKAKQAAEEKMVDDGKGELTIWVISNFDKHPVDKSMYGQFYSGDSYICLYKYFVGTRQMGIIYFWQGRKSSQDEKGTSALLTKQLADELAALKPSQVRVVQNAEPSHFLSLFKGKMVIHEGGRASGFSNSAEKDSLTAGETGLYHVRGTTALNTRAVQVDATATSLNSGDCFVLLTPSAAYAWFGVGSADSERAFAVNTLNLLKGGRPAVSVEEGSEPAEFWDALGGQQEYPSTGSIQSGDYEPRLFQVNNSHGHIVIKEVVNFSQDDLCHDDVMILDAGSEVFVWVGPSSNQAEKDGAVTAALQYVKNLPEGENTPIFRVDAGFEPPSFTCNFLGWDNSKAQDFSDPYAKKLASAKLGAAGAGAADEKKAAAAVVAPAGGVAKITGTSSQFKDPLTNKFTVAQIKAGQDGVDPARKEAYLSDAEFKTVFGMDIAAFNAQPGWKKEAAKKKAGLF